MDRSHRTKFETEDESLHGERLLNFSESVKPRQHELANLDARPGDDKINEDTEDEADLVGVIARDAADDDIDDMKTNNPNASVTQKREHWTRGIDFLLTVLGYSIGLGNLWRFPYLCVRNGGGTFVVPFIICVVICGLPMIFLETCLGQFSGQNNVNVWINICPLFKGIGFTMLIPTIIITLYQTIIMAWILYFLGNSFLANLPWDSCSRSWNTDKCFMPSTTANVTATKANDTSQANITKTTLHTSTEEFWRLHVLDLSSGIEEIGSMKGHLIISLAVGWLIIFVCIVKGVHSVGKVVYVTVFLPYILLTTFFIKGLTLQGSMDGIWYYFTPDPSKLTEIRVWVEAAVHVFFSLGQGWGAIITMASFNKFNQNCLRDAMLICFIGEGTSVFCGLVVFTILGFVAHELQVPVSKVVDSGPGLGFVVYPKALSKLPVPQLWSVLFFLMLVSLALDSQFGLVENVITVLSDLSPRLHKRRTWIRLTGCVFGFVVGLPFCTQGGMYIFQLMDWYIAAIFVPIVCALECVVVAWVYGAERFNRDVKLMLGRGLPVFMRICLCITTPLVYILTFVFIIRNYKPPSYGKYNYPVAGQVFGWILAVLPVLSLPVAAGLELRKHRNKPTWKLFADSTTPSPRWMPNATEHQTTYKCEQVSEHDMSCLRRLKVNILGK